MVTSETSPLCLSFQLVELDLNNPLVNVRLAHVNMPNDGKKKRHNEYNTHIFRQFFFSLDLVATMNYNSENELNIIEIREERLTCFSIPFV